MEMGNVSGIALVARRQSDLDQGHRERGTAGI
jgi:hypothetical protein